MAVKSNQCKVVTAEADSFGGRRESAAQQIAETLQDSVAGGAAVVLVDLLEAVDIDEQQAHAGGQLMRVGKKKALCMSPATCVCKFNNLIEAGRIRRTRTARKMRCEPV